MHIGLNAHLLSAEKSYRAAGIHGYIYNTLMHLAAHAPDDWRFTVMVGKGNRHQFPDVTMQPAMLDTTSPLRRVIWEQAIQPWGLGRFDLYNAMAFVAPLMQTAPSVVTVYDLSFIHYPQVLSSARRAYLRTLTAWSCHRARRVIAISQSTADDVHKLLGIPREKIDVALAGYDKTRFVPLPDQDIIAFKAKNNLPERFWLFLGTLEPRKNLPTLIDAYAQLHPNGRLPLVLAGGKGWDYAPIFERIEKHSLQSQIHTPGFIPAEDLPLWYNSADVFVYPSVFEGFGLPVLEAMACGTPVIVSDASSLPEVAGDVGHTVPPHDVDAWVAALKQAREWRTKPHQPSLDQAARFDWQHTAQATITSYQRALA